MINEVRKRVENYEEGRKKSEVEFTKFIEECLDEGWSPTKCSMCCVVEPDGICPHGFRSIALEYGFM